MHCICAAQQSFPIKAGTPDHIHRWSNTRNAQRNKDDLVFIDGANTYTLAWLAQVVDGNRLIMTPYDLSFRKDKADAKLCTKTLTKSEIMQFRKVRHSLAASLSGLAGPGSLSGHEYACTFSLLWWSRMRCPSSVKAWVLYAGSVRRFLLSDVL